MGTPPMGGGAERWARLLYQTEIPSREAFHDSASANIVLIIIMKTTMKMEKV